MLKRKNIRFMTAAVLVSAAASAQGIVNNGAYIVMSGASQIYISGGASGGYLSQSNGIITPSAAGVITLEGNWTNNSFANYGFSADAGTVIMNGGAQSINAAALATNFYNLTLQGTGTKTLNYITGVGGMTTTTGVLSLGTRPLDLNSNQLVITNPAAGAITYTTGYIISETNVASNPSSVYWGVGTSTGARVVPFGTVGGVQIPLTVNITSPMGFSTDYFQVATRPTLTSANTPWSTGVTHMFDPNLNQDGSDEAVIDRWWDASFSANATATLTFSYRGSENTMIAPYQTGNIGAQYWSAAWLPNNSNIGSAPAVTTGVGTVTAAGIPFALGINTPMVLSSLAAPLPVEFLSLSASCNDNSAVVQWSTASEISNDYFEVERSADGQNYTPIGTVNSLAPGGNSSSALYYSFADNSPLTTTAYYRIRQVDFNGVSTTSGVQALMPCSNVSGGAVTVFGTGDHVNVQIEAVTAADYQVDVIDLRGRLVARWLFAAEKGVNHFRFPIISSESSLYIVNVSSPASVPASRKIFLSATQN